MKKTRIDLTGRKFGRLTVEKYAFTKEKFAFWECICECGNKTIVRAGSLLSGNTQSCGCLYREHKLPIHKTHGFARTRIYEIWGKMKCRCSNSKHPQYNCYGGRGITVCDEWLKFEPFLEWSKNNGYAENLSIDRINNNKGYSPDNCRWTTAKVQANNRRKNRYITYNNETHTVAEWARIYDIEPSTLRNRLEKNWTIEEALTTKVREIRHTSKK